MTATPTIRTQFVLLAPSRPLVPRLLPKVVTHQQRYKDLLAEMQIVRGRTYLRDGAIAPWQLSPEGRHRLAVDNSSWHLLALTTRMEEFVGACATWNIGILLRLMR